MKIHSFLILIFLLQLVSSRKEVTAHPLHLSVTNVLVENGTVNVSMKTFIDDWQTAYFHYHSQVINFTVPANRKLAWFTDYLVRSFRITPEGMENPLRLSRDTILLDDQSMTIKMHAEIPARIHTLSIYNSLLTDIFPDQTNLVIVGYKGKETGIKFDFKKQDEEVRLN